MRTSQRPRSRARPRGDDVDDALLELIVAPSLSQTVGERDEQILERHIRRFAPARMRAAHSGDAWVDAMSKEQRTAVVLVRAP